MNFHSFSDELQKIALSSQNITQAQMNSAVPADPKTTQAVQSAQRAGKVSPGVKYLRSNTTGMVTKVGSSNNQNNRMNREKTKQLLKNTALVAGGTGVGVGLAEGARAIAKRYRGAPTKFRQIAAAGIPLVGGLAVLRMKKELDKEKKRLLDDAYQRGMKAGQRDF